MKNLNSGGTKSGKQIKTMELWSKKERQYLAGISVLSDKEVEWVAQKNIHTIDGWYYQFTDVKGMKFNWIIKLWAKLNNLL